MVCVNGALSSNASTPSSTITMAERQSESISQSRKRLLHLKRRKLDLIPNPPPLSPIPIALSVGVKKEFKVPRRVRTKGIDDTENEKE